MSDLKTLYRTHTYTLMPCTHARACTHTYLTETHKIRMNKIASGAQKEQKSGAVGWSLWAELSAGPFAAGDS